MRAIQLDSRSGLLKWVCGWVVLLGVIVPAHAVWSAQDGTRCGHSTVEDAWGPAVASQAQSFLASLQRVVRANDKLQFASLVHYPVRVVDGGRTTEISSPSDLLKKYSSILTENVKRAILTQSPTCLFGNGQGMMVGRGQVWFQREPSGEMKVVTINLAAPKVSE